MWRSVLTYSIAATCLVLGLAIAGYKHWTLSFPLAPDSEVNSWYVEFHTNLQSRPKRYLDDDRQKEAVVEIITPTSSDHYAVVNKQIIARGFGKQLTGQTGQSVMQFTKRGAEETETISVRFMLYELMINESSEVGTNGDTTDYLKTAYAKEKRIFNPDESIAALYDTIDLVIDDALDKSASAQSFLSELWKVLEKDEETAEYLMREMNIKHKANLMMVLSRVAGYPARVANGLHLEQRIVSSARLLRWVEIQHKGVWRMFDQETGNYIPEETRLYRWWTGTRDLVQTNAFDQYVTTISIKPNTDSSLTRALWQASEQQPIAYRMAIQNLPFDQQMVLQILLLLPLGALIVAVMRQVVGVKTFGTFMPVLISLAFRETGLSSGIIFFVCLTFVGLLLRGYLGHLRLLLVPRLSAVLCIVVALIMLVMLTFNDSEIPAGVSIALFPVVIMTMFIERMSTMWEEKGARPTLIAFAGSLSTAVLVYLVIMNAYVKHAMVTFPELLLVIFACCLMLGRYTGFRFTEYLRFRELKREMLARQAATGQEGKTH